VGTGKPLCDRLVGQEHLRLKGGKIHLIPDGASPPEIEKWEKEVGKRKRGKRERERRDKSRLYEWLV